MKRKSLRIAGLGLLTLMALAGCHRHVAQFKLSGIYGNESLGATACYKFTALGSGYSTKTLPLLGTHQTEFRYEIRHENEIWTSESPDGPIDTYFGRIQPDGSIAWRDLSPVPLTQVAGKQFCNRFD